MKFMTKILASVLWVLIVGSTPAFAERTWCWSITGSGVSVRGSVVTDDKADAAGFYRIVGITGRANAASVTTLQPAGTSIPGNAGYPVDNLIRNATPQLTRHGFGFATSDGTYHNAFHLEHYRDYISRPPYADGKGTEPTVQFKAEIAATGADCSAN